MERNYFFHYFWLHPAITFLMYFLYILQSFLLYLQSFMYVYRYLILTYISLKNRKIRRNVYKCLLPYEYRNIHYFPIYTMRLLLFCSQTLEEERRFLLFFWYTIEEEYRLTISSIRIPQLLHLKIINFLIIILMTILNVYVYKQFLKVC